MKEEEGKKIGYRGVRVAHGRASTGTGRATGSSFLCFRKLWGQTRAVPLRIKDNGFNFFRFSHHHWTNTYKTNKIKAIIPVGCIPRRARLLSLA